MTIQQEFQQIVDNPWSKIILGLGPSLGQLINLNSVMTERSRWTRSAENQLGSFGPLYFWICRVPHLLLFAAIFLLIFYGILVFSVGVWELSGGDAPPLLLALVRPYFLFFILYLILVILANFNLLSLLVLHLVGRFGDLRFRPGWVNAYWHLYDGKEAIPVNVNTNNCDRVAGQILKGITEKKLQGQEDKATKPDGFHPVVLANALLFGTFIEHNYYQQTLSHGIKFAEFYALLFEAHRSRGLFSSTSLRSLCLRDRSVYDELRAFAPGSPQFPPSLVLADRVKELNRQLYRYTDGHAHELAIGGVLWKTASAARANRALLRFPGFRESSSIRALFFKLALDMGVWRIDPGPFVYGFSKNVTRTLLGTECLVTRSSEKVITLDDNLRNLSAWTVKTIVDSLHRLIRSNADNQEVQNYCKATFGCPPIEVEQWSLAREIDYLIWHYSRHAPDVLVGEFITNWKIDGNTFKRDEKPEVKEK